MRQGRWLSDGFVCLGEPEKSFADGFGKHGGFGSAFLLLEDQERFAEMGIAAPYFLEQNGDLSVLATQTEDGCASYVGMVNVTGEQGTEIVGILVSAAAAPFVS